jgi:hypothetical protein
MDMHEDIKAAPALPATWGDLAVAAVLPPAGCPQAAEPRAGEPPAREPPANQPTIEPKIGLARIVSPPLSSTVETTPAAGGVDAPEIEPPLAAKRFEETKPEGRAAASREIMLLGSPARAPASRKSSEFIWLAALVILAAAFGAAGGVLGATGLTRLAGEAAPAEPTAVLQTAIAELRSDITALKAGLDTTGRNTGAQYTKLVERLDRAEHAQSVASKSDAAFPKEAVKEAIKETTGSVTTPASATAAPLSLAPVLASGTQTSGTPPSAIVSGWAVRDVYRGVAMLQSRMGSMVEVEAGDVLPNLGRIEAIRRQDGRWVVITSRGMIMSMR